MRQGQQNRRSRGRGSNNSSNANRKQQNPLSRNYESNGPDVKIRGTASQIAEKYSTLARDASSSGDVIMAENYLQHAEHYNRIIMATQAQVSQPVAHNGTDASHAMNGAHRPGREALNGMREQPQPDVNEQPSVEQPVPAQAEAANPVPDEQPSVADDPAADEVAAKEPAKQTAKSRSSGEADAGRRRRRRYPGSSEEGTARAPAAERSGGDDKVANAASEDQPSDEATAQ